MKKSKYPKLSQLYREGIGDLYGSDTFWGTGNYGIGNQKQLAAIDPSVKKIQDQEQEEHNANIDNLQGRLGKWKKSFGGPIGPIEPTQSDVNRGIGSNPKGGSSKLKTPMVQKLSQQEQRLPGDGLYRDMRGTPIDSLEEPVRHVPSDRGVEIDIEMKKSLEDYMDAVEQHCEYIAEVYPYTSIAKQGNVSNTGRVDQGGFLVAPKDFLKDIEAPEDSPFGQMGVVVSPRDFVPDSFEGRKDYTDDWTDEHYSDYRDEMENKLGIDEDENNDR